jgi:hypothetical protein
VTDGADVHMRLGAFKLGLGHGISPLRFDVPGRSPAYGAR